MVHFQNIYQQFKRTLYKGTFCSPHHIAIERTDFREEMKGKNEQRQLKCNLCCCV